jgi:hypothetical protein
MTAAMQWLGDRDLLMHAHDDVSAIRDARYIPAVPVSDGCGLADALLRWRSHRVPAGSGGACPCQPANASSSSQTSPACAEEYHDQPMMIATDAINWHNTGAELVVRFEESC